MGSGPRKEWVDPRSIKKPEAGDLYYVARDDRLVSLLRRAETGEIPTTRTTARLADVDAHDPEALERVRANLWEEPSTRNALVMTMLQDRPHLLVYRNEAGRLVMFDDYAKFAVAQDSSLQEIRVQIIGE